MKTGNWDYVYLTRDSYSGYTRVWNTNIGIVKYEGCHEFRSASSLGKTKRSYYKDFSGSICCDHYGPRIKKQFGFVPPKGTAWLINTTTLKRKRIDKDIALIDPDTGKVVG